MLKSAKEKNQVTLAPSPLAASDIPSENEQVEHSRRERMERQRAQRLARDLGDEKAVSIDPEDAGKSQRLPQAHRRQC
jgi:hypothetical protein